jgi:hypothetical protein
LHRDRRVLCDGRFRAMSTKYVSFALGAVLIAFALGYGVRVLADGAPTEQPLFYSGTLESAGQLVSGAHTVSLGLYSAEQGGTALCALEREADVEAGRFRIDVAECAEAMRANADVWVAVAFRGSDGVDHAIEGRAKVGAVPYALEADRAKVADAAGGALQDTVQALMDRVAALEGNAPSSTAFHATSTVSPDLGVGATMVVFDEEHLDTGDEYDPETGVFAPKADGHYEVICSLAWATDSHDVDHFEAAVFVNGIERSYTGMTTEKYATTRQVHVVLQLAAGDDVTCHAYQEDDTLELNVGGQNVSFVGRRFAL